MSDHETHDHLSKAVMKATPRTSFKGKFSDVKHYMRIKISQNAFQESYRVML